MSDQQRTEIRHATLHAVAEGVSQHRHLEVHGLTDSGNARLLAELLAESDATFAILVADQKQAARIASDLSFYRRQQDTFFFPNWEVGPYDPLSPHPEVEAERVAALAAMHGGQARAVIVPVRSLMQRVMPRPALNELTLRLLLEEEYPRDTLKKNLLGLGYLPVPLVEDRGTFSLRGDILDIFPAAGEKPLRIDFFGDYIERIRYFSVVDQRAAESGLKEILLTPVKEMVLAGPLLDRFLQRLKERCDELDMARTRREDILDEARESLLAPGREFLLSLNYDHLSTLFDYLPQASWVLIDPPAIEQAADQFAAEVADGEKRIAASGEPYVAAPELFLTPGELLEGVDSGQRLDLTRLQLYHLEADWPLYRIEAESNADLSYRAEQQESVLARLVERLSGWQEDNWRMLFVCHQIGQAERLQSMLDGHGLTVPLQPEARLLDLEPGAMAIAVGEVSSGFRLPDEHLALFTEEDIFGARAHRRSRREKQRALLPSLAELKEGDFIVHTDHGVGRYHGLQHLATGTTEGDFLIVEYADDDKLYLPIDRIEKVQKYVGSEGHQPKLDKMGGSAWEKAKLKARSAVEEMARDLLKIQAKRQMNKGYPYPPPDNDFRAFEATFPYEETTDQLAAIEEVLEDLQSEKPMDRLVCGDVGYGKTEVAIRAAYRVALEGKQVALLVPTTILARQHWATLRDRFKGTPVEVEMLSRLRRPAEQKQILQRVADGKIDIIIGTHRLLQRDVQFKELGLVIIDEEQRFGVSHKEKLKRFRAEVDVLTMTATPIPRTLQLGMLGLRALSVIDTPPVDRLAIRTYVSRFDDDLIRQAILRELHRGGQVFFVHNRVQTIDAMADFIRQLVPEAKVAVGHGQMGERALEQVMLGFIEGKNNVLVCSTIIENGIDIPRANTIIVNRADCFGLSQLYQLRGRVGRSDRRAYAYLLIPGEGVLNRDARERLRILQEQTELGAGFRIASHDLELRGAGELLGAKQAGQVMAVGFEMYTELLAETIAELQGLEKEDRIDPDIRLGLSAYLPEDYMRDPNQRLVFYRRMAAAETEQSLYDLADELRERYGKIPKAGSMLLEVMKLRVMLKKLRIESAEFDGRRLVFGFHASTIVPPDKILQRLQQPGSKSNFSPDFKLTLEVGRLDDSELLETAKKELLAFL